VGILGNMHFLVWAVVAALAPASAPAPKVDQEAIEEVTFALRSNQYDAR
jgi:hypothetical protein